MHPITEDDNTGGYRPPIIREQARRYPGAHAENRFDEDEIVIRIETPRNHQSRSEGPGIFDEGYASEKPHTREAHSHYRAGPERHVMIDDDYYHREPSRTRHDMSASYAGDERAKSYLVRKKHNTTDRSRSWHSRVSPSHRPDNEGGKTPSEKHIPPGLRPNPYSRVSDAPMRGTEISMLKTLPSSANVFDGICRTRQQRSSRTNQGLKARRNQRVEARRDPYCPTTQETHSIHSFWKPQSSSQHARIR